ncbi:MULTISPECIES: ferric reductase-like transmembrane domain-containing protein [Brevibacillus]|uniref:ferric reductase-like transmembrane domain-containing protein n=1 Tax=Brevibacillus TaxID=55080 RepID=UPI0002A5071D|nr:MULTISPECIES: ferric reductase-like transmembrane domain-containing protein [Brevibacillus]ELK39693.1 hypothetical protein D478_23008 [Brevibacillus agri BAB-2500]MBY0054063.1 ferric reductase-like transmembrane domain-containing protein [Brevibacillus agri]MDN4094382.1 ferric reductase-like transmembrane domain-containing protein [Brevibacillus agri]MDR9504709.1 ferric reductase-like transmembrane domain-containing protein [Brevibacillus agri]MED3498780.1 ferric reductase-like transmembran
MNTPRRHLLRLLAHIMSLLIVLIGAAWMWPDFSAFPAMEACSMIAGYLSFLLIGLTLLIGPIKSWLPGRWTAACLSIRRDVGIWAGLTGILHVCLVLILFEGEPKLYMISDTRPDQTGGWLRLFLYAPPESGVWPIPNWSFTGVANYLGAIAFILLLALLCTSSGRAEKWLGGSAWKRLHLANPWLFLLVLFHGLIYIQSIKGEPHSFSDLLVFAVVVWFVRSLSFGRTVLKRRR